MLNSIYTNEDWSSIKTCVGNAEHIPEALLTLISDDENIVGAAYWKIENYAVVQGDLSEAAQYIPKYLEEVIIKAQFKGAALELLFQIGNGVSIDKKLQNECYQQAVSILERLQHHKAVKETKWEKVIQEDIRDLTLYNESHK